MRKVLSALLATLLLISGSSSCMAADLSRVYLDGDGNVHSVSTVGQDARLTTAGGMLQPAVAPDGRTVAWLVNQEFEVDGEKMSGASVLMIQRSGHQRTIRCEPFIRQFWFWGRGKYVAIDCGGSHFAGSEILYDTRTLKKVAAVDTAEVPPEKRPRWSSSSKDYRAD